MAEDIGSLIVRIEANMSNLQDGLNSAAERVDSFGSKLAGIGKLIAGAFIVNKVAEFAKESVKLASDLQEVQNVVDTVFVGGAKEIGEFSKTAAAKFGLSELAAKKFTSTIGSMFSSMGLGEKETLKMSEGIAGLSGDMASFFNLKPEEAFEKLRSGISGETEPLKQLGINMSVANLEAFALSQGMNKQFKDMSQAEQATLRYNFILDATSKAQGDFSKTSGSLANQQRILTLNWQTIQTTVGNALIPTLSKLSAWFISAMPTIQTAVTNATTIIGNAFTSIGTFIQPAIDVFTNFYNSIQENVTKGGSIFEGIGITIRDVFGSETVGAIKSVIDTATNLYNQIVPALKEAFDSFSTTTWPLLMDAFKGWINGVYPILADAFKFIVENVVPPLIKVFEFLATEVVPAVAAAFKEWMPKVVAIIKDLWEGIKPIIQFLVDAFNAAWPLIKDSVMNSVNVIKGVISGLLTALDGVIKFVTGVFTGDWGKAWEGVKQIFSGVWESLSAIGKGAINGLINIVNAGIRALNKLKIDVPDWLTETTGIKDFSLGIPEIPKLATGTNYVPFDQLAMIHKGEAVVPAKYNPSNPGASQPMMGQGQTINYDGMFNGATFNVRSDNDAKMIAREIFNLQKSKARGSGVVYG